LWIEGVGLGRGRGEERKTDRRTRNQGKRRSKYVQDTKGVREINKDRENVEGRWGEKERENFMSGHYF
jgi:hypothetical protein